MLLRSLSVFLAISPTLSLALLCPWSGYLFLSGLGPYLILWLYLLLALPLALALTQELEPEYPGT